MSVCSTDSSVDMAGSDCQPTPISAHQQILQNVISKCLMSGCGVQRSEVTKCCSHHHPPPGQTAGSAPVCGAGSSRSVPYQSSPSDPAGESCVVRKGLTSVIRSRCGHSLDEHVSELGELAVFAVLDLNEAPLGLSAEQLLSPD